MNRHQGPRAVVRARWFAELSAALDDGDRILAELATEGSSPAETERLRLRLVELRAELERLNRVNLSGGRVMGSGWPQGPDQPAEQTALHRDWLPRRDWPA